MSNKASVSRSGSERNTWNDTAALAASRALEVAGHSVILACEMDGGGAGKLMGGGRKERARTGC
jgi:hypothetical protein